MKEESGKKDEIRMSAPWGGRNVSQQGGFFDPESAKCFIEQRSQVHSTYIIEQEKTKRLYLVLSVILLICALLIMVFAPEGKEQMSYWIGGALLVFSAGAAGYKRFWAKAPMIEFDAGSE